MRPARAQGVGPVSRLETVPGRVLTAAGPLLLGAVLICLPAVLSNYGPHVFASRWFAILYLPLRLGGAALAAFPAFQCTLVQAMTSGVEIGARKHFVTQLVIDKHGEADAFVVERIQEAACPLGKATAKENKISCALRQAVRLKDPVSLAIGGIAITCDLSHLFTHHKSYFAIKNV